MTFNGPFQFKQFKQFYKICIKIRKFDSFPVQENLILRQDKPFPEFLKCTLLSWGIYLQDFVFKFLILGYFIGVFLLSVLIYRNNYMGNIKVRELIAVDRAQDWTSTSCKV